MTESTIGKKLDIRRVSMRSGNPGDMLLADGTDLRDLFSTSQAATEQVLPAPAAIASQAPLTETHPAPTPSSPVSIAAKGADSGDIFHA